MESFQVAADVRALYESLGRLPPPQVHPAFIIASGLPGTGKTTFCRKLAERLPAIVLESDALRKRLFPTPAYSADESAALFSAIHEVIDGLLKQRISVILDATNLEERHRGRLYRIASERKARLIIVRVKAPPEVVYKRLTARSYGKKAGETSDADWEIYRRMLSTSDRITRRHYAVDTSRDINPVIERIVREANAGKE